MEDRTRVGEVALFVLPSKEVTPCIITRVNSANGQNTDITLLNNTDSGEFRNASIHRSVKYSDDPSVPGTWHHQSESRQAARA